MATLYSDANGNLIRLLQTADEEKQFGAPPNTASTLVFDENTNAGVITAINSDWNSHRLSGGVLTRNGQAVAIAADSNLRSERQQLQTIRDGLTQYMGVASPTLAQTAQAVKLIIRLLALIMDYYLKRLGQT